MNYLKYIITIFILSFTLCCDKIVEKEQNQQDFLKGQIIDTDLPYLAKNEKNNYNILYIFNGECSMCLADFLDYLRNTSEITLNSEIPVYFISFSLDTYTIEHYMNESNLSLTENQYLLSDKDNMIMALNNYLDPYKNILLVGPDNKIVTSMDPFKFEQTMELYKELKVYQ